MNQERRARYLQRVALREAQKAMRQQGGEPLTRDELLELRIQAVEPWKRILLVLIGAIPTGLAIFFLLEDGADAYVRAGFLGLIGGALILAGILGRKKTVDACLDNMGADFAEFILRSILDGP